MTVRGGRGVGGMKWRALIWAVLKTFPVCETWEGREDEEKKKRSENGKSKYLSRSIGRKTAFMSSVLVVVVVASFSCFILIFIFTASVIARFCILSCSSFYLYKRRRWKEIIFENLLVNTNNSKYLTFYFSPWKWQRFSCVKINFCCQCRLESVEIIMAWIENIVKFTASSNNIP